MCYNCVLDGTITLKCFNLIEAFEELWPSAEFGPGHIVIADNNIRDANIDGCIQDCLETLQIAPVSAGNEELVKIWRTHGVAETEAVLAFLEMLRAMPIEERGKPEYA